MFFTWIRSVIRLRPGGASRDRTDDPLLAKQVLSQLSYGPLSPDPTTSMHWWV